MKALKHVWSLFAFFLAALIPAHCSALSVPNSPCDVGGGFFFFLPSYHDEHWHIYHEDESGKTICYHTDNQEDFDPGWRPDYDFDETWVYISDEIFEPKYAKPDSVDENLPEGQSPERKSPPRRERRQVYFLFNKETREMTGPMTSEEFFEHPAVMGKHFAWKRGDYKDTSGVGRFLFMVFSFTIIFLLVLFTVLSYFFIKLIGLLFGKRETDLGLEFQGGKVSVEENFETGNPYQPPEDRRP